MRRPAARPLVLGLALTLSATLVPAAAAGPPAGPADPVVAPAPDAGSLLPGELLVRRAPGVPAQAVLDAVPAVLARRGLPFAAGVDLVTVPPGTEQEAVDRLSRAPGVAWVERNAVLRAATVPDDPGFVAQWHLQRRTAELPGTANWEPVNGTPATGEGMLVAVVDTGVTPSAELAVTSGFDFVEGDAVADDEDGHGTHVAGTVAQRTGNGLGVAGVAPLATVLPVRVLDASGAGSTAQVVSGIGFAAARGASVINLSLGGADSGGTALCEAVASATAAGALVVAATGNEAGPVAFPAACPDALAVSAGTLTGSLAAYSNSGPETDLAAPGGDVTADADGDGFPDGVLQFTTLDGTPGFYFLNGTSMAAPHVAGAAALVRQVRPELTPQQAAAVLTGSAVDAGTPGPDDQFGAGLLDIGAAVAAVGVRLTGTGGEEPVAEDAPPTMTAPTTGTTTTTTEGTRRLAGTDRYSTAVAASQAGWAGGTETAFLASGVAFPDALAATAAAGAADAPLLLTAPCALPDSTREELQRLTPSAVVLLGGPAAVCDGVVDAVQAAIGVRPQRVQGRDRYETAAALAADVQPGVADVFLASGEAFPDALAGGVRAARGRTALLLTRPCSLPPATAAQLARLRPAQVTVLGGSSAVCDDVARQAAQAAGGVPVRRLAGGTRFETAAAVATDGRADAAVVGVANGLRFADALAGGPYLARQDAPLLLVGRDEVPAPTAGALLELQPSRIAVLGGDAAVSPTTVLQLEPFAAAR